jgi:hypothetical protein
VWKRDVRQDLKATRRPSASVKALNALSEQITTSQSSINSKFSTLNSTMSSGLKEVVHAIKTQSQPNTPSNSSPLGVNWTPIIQGLVTAVATTLGASVKFTPTGQSSDEVPLANSSTLETPVSQENLTLTPYGPF